MKTLKELATELAITPDSLRQRIARGTLMAQKRGRDWFVGKMESERLIKEKYGKR